MHLLVPKLLAFASPRSVGPTGPIRFLISQPRRAQFALWVWLLLLGCMGATLAQNGPSCSSFTNRTTDNGLGNNNVIGVYVVGSNVYAATQGGLGISTNGGQSFTNRTTANGLGNDLVSGVYVVGSTVYAATNGGLSISTDGGQSFTNRTTANGLGSNTVRRVYVAGSSIYAATIGGLSSCTQAALPVSFTYFIGKNTPLGNQIQWQTSMETQNAGFTVLKGSVPTSLEACASIPSQAEWGNATARLSYSFIDAAPASLITYYRLRQTDFDGAQHLSPVIAVRSGESRPVLFPNPATGLLTLEPPQPYTRYQLLDAAGRLVQAVGQGGTLGQFVLPSELAGGSYLLVVEAPDGTRHTYRLVR